MGTAKHFLRPQGQWLVHNVIHVVCPVLFRRLGLKWVRQSFLSYADGGPCTIRWHALCLLEKLRLELCRTYPQGYKPPDEPPSEYQTIPLNRIEDFGVHYKQVTVNLHMWSSRADMAIVKRYIVLVSACMYTSCALYLLAKILASIFSCPFSLTVIFVIVSLLVFCGTKLLYRSFYTGINI
jgi:hypothetical protein